MKPKFRVLRSAAASTVTVVAVMSIAASSSIFADTGWTGATNTDWADAGNWDNGLPAAGGLTYINDISVNTPTLTGSATQDRLHIGAGTLNVNSSGTLATTTSSGNWWSDWSLGIGEGTGNTGTFNLQSGTVDIGGPSVWVGIWGGSGVWNQTGGTANVSGLFSVGNYEDVQGLTTGTATIENGTLNAGTVYVARGRSSVDIITATMDVNSGGIVNSAGETYIGFAGSSAATGTLSINNGGTFNAGTTGTNDKSVWVGRWDTANATLNVNSGGTLNLQNGTDVRLQNAGATQTVVVDGGTIQGSTGSWLKGGNATSTITIQNNGQVLGMTDGHDTWDGKTIVKTGGVLETGAVSGASGIAGQGLYIDGGTVRATGDQVDFINFWGGSAEAHISAGGATIDNAGFSIGVTGNDNGLLEDAASTGGGVTFTGTGTTTLASTNTYTGATVVSAGTLLVNGALGATDVSVESGATIGGSGSLAGNLDIAAGANFLFGALNTLDVTGSVTFGSFGIANLTGLDNTVDAGTYTVISGTVDFTNVTDVGLVNAVDLGGGKSAYLQAGSLQVVVIPEPSAALIGCLGIICLLRRRRSA